jgi:hypothetical protein
MFLLPAVRPPSSYTEPTEVNPNRIARLLGEILRNAVQCGGDTHARLGSRIAARFMWVGLETEISGCAGSRHMQPGCSTTSIHLVNPWQQ